MKTLHCRVPKPYIVGSTLQAENPTSTLQTPYNHPTNTLQAPYNQESGSQIWPYKHPTTTLQCRVLVEFFFSTFYCAWTYVSCVFSIWKKPGRNTSISKHKKKTKTNQEIYTLTTFLILIQAYKVKHGRANDRGSTSTNWGVGDRRFTLCFRHFDEVTP